MKPKEFLSRLEHDAIVTAIRKAEEKTSGEIRVFISHHRPADPVAAAQEQFLRLGMEKTEGRNGVLIFIAPLVRKFAVIGDSGVHAKCGDEFWKEVAEQISTHFRSQGFTKGIVHGIERAGALLAQHFPRRPDDRNQLPDEVEEG